MPRKKFMRRRFKRSKKSGFGSTIVNVAKKAYKGFKFLKSIVNTEKHFFDTSLGQTNTAVAGAIYATDYMQQGDAFNNRAGNSCLIKSFQVRFQLTTATANNTRIIILLDKENRAATPAVTDVLETASLQSPINHTNGHRFIILRDKIYNVNAAGQIYVNPKFYIKCNHHARYNDGNAGSSADFRENHIYFIVISDTTTGVYTYYTRIRFIDN